VGPDRTAASRSTSSRRRRALIAKWRLRTRKPLLVGPDVHEQSGQAVSALAFSRSSRRPARDVIDEVHLPLGKLRAAAVGRRAQRAEVVIRTSAAGSALRRRQAAAISGTCGHVLSRFGKTGGGGRAQ
jgi:hypothetical protein